MPEHLHRIIGSRHDLELGNGPWRALARRRIVDAVAGMHVVQRHPLLRLEVLRRVVRSTGIRANGSALRGLGRLYRNHAIEAVNLGHHPCSAKAAEVRTVSSAVPAKPILATVMAISIPRFYFGGRPQNRMKVPISRPAAKDQSPKVQAETTRTRSRC